MLQFAQYQRSNPTSRPHIRWVQRLGLIPMCIAAALIVATPSGGGPGLWTALGLSAGMELILWGAAQLYSSLEKRTAFGDWLVRNHDRWFPIMVFAMKYAFIALSLAVLWLTIIDLGFPAAAWHHVVFACIVLLLPVGQAIRQQAGADPTPRLEAWDNICHCLNIILITIILSSLLGKLIVEQSSPYGTETDPLVLMIWVLALLIMAGAMITYLGRLVRRKRPSPRWRMRENSPTSAGKY